MRFCGWLAIAGLLGCLLGGCAEKEEPVFFDVTELVDPIRTQKMVETFKDPLVLEGKRIRLDGEAIYGRDDNGRPTYAVSVCDTDGCCSLLTIGYQPISTNNLPGEGYTVLVDGIFRVTGDKDDPHFVICNATANAVRTKAPAAD